MSQAQLVEALLGTEDYSAARWHLEQFKEAEGTPEEWREAMALACERGMARSPSSGGAFYFLLLACRAGHVEHAKKIVDGQGVHILQGKVSGGGPARRSHQTKLINTTPPFLQTYNHPSECSHPRGLYGRKSRVGSLFAGNGRCTAIRISSRFP